MSQLDKAFISSIELYMLSHSCLYVIKYVVEEGGLHWLGDWTCVGVPVYWYIWNLKNAAIQWPQLHLFRLSGGRSSSHDLVIKPRHTCRVYCSVGPVHRKIYIFCGPH